MPLLHSVCTAAERVISTALRARPSIRTAVKMHLRDTEPQVGWHQSTALVPDRRGIRGVVTATLQRERRSLRPGRHDGAEGVGLGRDRGDDVQAGRRIADEHLEESAHRAKPRDRRRVSGGRRGRFEGGDRRFGLAKRPEERAASSHRNVLVSGGSELRVPLEHILGLGSACLSGQRHAECEQRLRVLACDQCGARQALCQFEIGETQRERGRCGEPLRRRVQFGVEAKPRVPQHVLDAGGSAVRRVGCSPLRREKPTQSQPPVRAHPRPGDLDEERMCGLQLEPGRRVRSADEPFAFGALDDRGADDPLVHRASQRRRDGQQIDEVRHPGVERVQ